MEHTESHFSASDTVRDLVIGVADGLTVPFALAAGLSGVVTTTNLVVTAGVAEMAAGAIAMGLGGYLAARTDDQHYGAELQRETSEIEQSPAHEKAEVAEILVKYGIPPAHVNTVVESIAADRTRWLDFMMRFELGLEKPHRNRASQSAVTIGGAYLLGGLIPLLPYMLTSNVQVALTFSIGLTLIALLAFGAGKATWIGTPVLKGGIQTAAVGGTAAAVAFLVARLVA